jgi:tetratricopeptide (TPR) repeat protein
MENLTIVSVGKKPGLNRYKTLILDKITDINSHLDSISTPFVLILDKNSSIDEDSVKKMLNLMPSCDIAFANTIFSYQNSKLIRHYRQNHTEPLIQALDLQEYMPPSGYMVKKEILKPFKDYGHMSMYGFIYKHLNSAKFLHAKDAFLNYKQDLEEIDKSYESLLLRDIVKLYDIKTLFQKLNWENPSIALATAYTLIGEKLSDYGDNYNAMEYFKKGLDSFHNQATYKYLIGSLLKMGEFEKAAGYIEKLQNDKTQMQGLLRYFQEAAKSIETIVKEGKDLPPKEELNSLLKLNSAPIDNAFGFLMFQLGNVEAAYGYFKKAFYENPLDENIWYNLENIAKHLNRYEEVLGLKRRIFS